MEPKTGKRIVSKSAYLKAQADRATISLFGVGLWLGAVFLGLIAGGCCLGSLANLCWGESLGARLAGGILCLAAAILTGGMAYLVQIAGKEMMKQAADMTPGVPLTRANTANLPAPDSLVRASSEPVQAYEAVLLRAASAGMETPPEQLVRASMRQE